MRTGGANGSVIGEEGYESADYVVEEKSLSENKLEEEKIAQNARMERRGLTGVPEVAR